MSRNGQPNSQDDQVSDRRAEYEEPPDIVAQKVKTLSEWIKDSKVTLFYTGAGISTAAEIPDYRGPKGVWTLTSQGKTVEKCTDMMSAQPTSTHMIMKEMYRSGLVTHILSQNCDGLHLRSGLPQRGISEIHGNMYIEVCPKCKPTRQYVRHFDVTAKSAFRKHGTGRDCIVCKEELVDTIVHFGEVGKVDYPLNWTGTSKLVDDADVIVCIGTSLNVLKSYKFLFPNNEKTKLVIVNLQWTPKDKYCTLKINAKADDVMDALAAQLNITPTFYCRDCDPILNPRRGARGGDLMAKITDCMCHIRAPRNRKCEDFEEFRQGKESDGRETRQPGWWTAGIERMKQERCFKKRKKSEDEDERDNVKTSSKETSVDSAESEEPKPTRKTTVNKKRKETLFERELRKLTLHLVNSVANTEQMALSGPRSRGRPKKLNYTLSIEHPGSFVILPNWEHPTFGHESMLYDETSIKAEPIAAISSKKRSSVRLKPVIVEKRKKSEEEEEALCSSSSEVEIESESSDPSDNEEEYDPAYQIPASQNKVVARLTSQEVAPIGALSRCCRVTRAAWRRSSQASTADDTSNQQDRMHNNGVKQESPCYAEDITKTEVHTITESNCDGESKLILDSTGSIVTANPINAEISSDSINGNVYSNEATECLDKSESVPIIFIDGQGILHAIAKSSHIVQEHHSCDKDEQETASLVNDLISKISENINNSSDVKNSSAPDVNDAVQQMIAQIELQTPHVEMD